MNSREKNARIVWRMKSVDVTRVMPRRCAASVAIVDFPVPVAPPTSRSERLVEPLQRLEPAQAATVRRRLVSPITSAASSPSRSRSRDDGAALGQVVVRAARDEVRALGVQPGRRRAPGP